MINLEWFRTFKATYEARSLSAAAQTLCISQPGASLHINSLESYTGYRLFDRDTRKMIATDKGTVLYNFIIEHINKLEEAENIFHHKSKFEKPTVSVGMSIEIFQFMLEAHVSELPFNLITRFGDYPQMLQELNNGTLDLILTPQKGTQHNLEYTPFTKERIILICGSKTDTSELENLIQKNDRPAIKEWLTAQIWYSTATDMEHLKRFWFASFDAEPRLCPNYVVPFYGSILRCLSNNTGFAVIPDYLCRQEIADNVIKLAWEGSPPVENILHFGKRKVSAHPKEIRQLEAILSKSWPALATMETDFDSHLNHKT